MKRAEREKKRRGNMENDREGERRKKEAKKGV